MLKIPIHAHGFTISTYTPMECLNIDFIGPFPDQGYILVIVDTFTRLVELYHTTDATALSAAECLRPLLIGDEKKPKWRRIEIFVAVFDFLDPYNTRRRKYSLYLIFFFFVATRWRRISQFFVATRLRRITITKNYHVSSMFNEMPESRFASLKTWLWPVPILLNYLYQKNVK